jgi:hypothetical protein
MIVYPTADISYSLRWKGSHTVNIFVYHREIDCFTFGWEKDKISQTEALSAIINYLSEEN